MEYPCRLCTTSYCYKNCDKFNNWLEEAEAAIEKQTRKKVQYRNINVESTMECPNGHCLPTTVRENRMPYCPFCGQRLYYWQ